MTGSQPLTLSQRRRLRYCLMTCLFVVSSSVLPLRTAWTQESESKRSLQELISAVDNAAGKQPNSPAAANLASQLVQEIQADLETELSDILNSMRGTSEIAQNWLLSIAQTIASRDEDSATKELHDFLQLEDTAPNARYWAFEFLTRDNQELRKSLLRNMLEDSSLELRYEAIKLGMQEIEQGDLDETQKIASYRKLFQSARLASQVQRIAKKLTELDQEVDLKKHFGFIGEWQTVGPFNNVDGVGFEAAYGPETDFAEGKLDNSRSYEGKSGTTKWKSVATTADDGAIDLAEAFEKEKGAVAYALAQFPCSSETQCQLRLGSPNATKVWLNGKLVMGREVYHSGNQIDQYVASVILNEGTNWILVKSCQNEQKDSWAQDWTFQLRFTDSTGAAIQPAL